ncbi:AMP-binding protein [Acinetobacter sp. HY1485]|uniref:AMP-binding protein n=1 Tax=Acinetobacter sp. HY1485 TaxID=2970918 RepID=UPI0022B9BA03|nr:AMP-binding protein [Acinetobacter sp. HY1485]
MIENLFVDNLLKNSADKFGENKFIETESASFSFEEINICSQIYSTLFREIIKKKNPKILIEASAQPEFVPILFAIFNVGGVAVPFNSSLPFQVLDFYKQEVETTLIIKINPESINLINGEEIINLPKINFILASQDNYLKKKVFVCPQIDRSPEDIALIIFTSGSTGKPKGVVSLHRQITFVAHSLAKALDYKTSDKIFLGLPFSFDYGLYQIYLSLIFGATLYIAPDKSSGLTLVKSLIESKATVLPAVGPMFTNLEYFCKKNPGLLSNLRLITNTGAHIPRKTLDLIRKALPDLKVQLMYGLTECKRVSITPPNQDILKKDTCGLPLPYTKVEIIDDEGKTLSVGQVGQIVVSGPHIMSGYWKDTEQTNAKFKKLNATEIRLLTGDYGYIDKDGFLYWEGRKDDIFKQNGFRVSASEIEEAALSISGVEFAVLLPKSYNEKSILFFTGSISSDDVKKELIEKIELYKIPFKINAIEEFKLTTNGKIDKKWLISLCNQ